MIYNIIQSVTEKLSSLPYIEGIVLGGSRARGTHTENSDIDIGIYYNQESFDLTAIKHLVTEHIAYHLFCRGSSLIGSDGFFCFTKQADVKIWSSVDEQTDVPSYGKLVTDMDGNIQVVRGTLIV